MGMTSHNTSKLKEMIKEAGFLPDSDLLEISELTVKECIKALGPNGSSITFEESAEWKRGIEKIKKHFGWT
jgi:hypothetical protein